MAEELLIKIRDEAVPFRPAAAPPTRPGDIRPNPDLDAAFGVRPPAPAAQPVATPVEQSAPAPTQPVVAPPGPTPPPSLPPSHHGPPPIPSGLATPPAAAPRAVQYTPGLQPPRPVATPVASAGEGAAGRAAAAGAAEGVAGRAAIGAGGAAGVAGGGALIAVSVIATAIEKGFQLASRATQVAGTVATQVAANDAVGAFATTTKAAADVMEKIPVVGTAVAEGFRFVATAATTFDQVVGAFVARARELAQYDGRIAEAAAQADVRRLTADIREAQQMGEQLAKLIDKQADLEILLREILLPMKVVVTDFLVEAIKVIIEYMTWVPFVGKYAQAAKERLDALKADEAKLADGLIQNWLNALDALGPDPRPAADPVGDAAIRERLNRPMGDII